MTAVRIPTMPVVLGALLVVCALAVPKATAESLTGTDLLEDSKRALIVYKIQPERLDDLSTDSGRTTLVSHVHQYCLGLEKTVPKNSPAEQDWLTEEMRSDSPDRMGKARFSAEWARWRMAMLINECLQWVDVYQEAKRGSGRYVVGKTGALIELGRAFGSHLEFAQEFVDTLNIDELTLHAVYAREIMDLSLFAAHRTLLE